MADRTHALLSASSASRWLICHPSARLADTLPENVSAEASEGTLAHAIAELKLKKYVSDMSTRKYNAALKKLQKDPFYKAEMLSNTDVYLDYIKAAVHKFDAPPYIAVEKKVSYDKYVNEGFGTCDCALVGGGILHIIDYKHGAGVPVDAYDNPQLKLYALGAYTEYSLFYPINTVQMSIIQPRVDGGITTWETDIQSLLNWGESIKSAAQTAFEGKGDFVPGKHCQFCKASALCRARADEFLSLEEDYSLKVPPLLSDDEVGQALIRARKVKAWVSKLEKYALASLLNGGEIPGWKAVQGYGNRVFTDTDKAFDVLKSNDIDEAVLYVRQPLTLTAVEDLIGKKKFKDLLSDFVDRPLGNPKLVLETDKGDPIKPITAAQDFA